MTMPTSDGTDGSIGAAVLLELGKLSTSVALVDKNVAVLTDKVSGLPERVRELELAQATKNGASDLWARILAIVAALGAAGAVAAQFLHH